jgi:hypothetical protein
VANPFDPEAAGAMAPDDWSIAGCTPFHVKMFDSIPMAGGSALVAFFPSPTISATSCYSSSTVFGSSTHPFVSNDLFTIGCLSISGLAAEFDAIQIVGGGVRVFNAQTFTAVTGTAWFAEYPGLETPINQSTITAMGGTSYVPLLGTSLGLTSVPTGATPGFYPQQTPGSIRRKADQMMENEILLRFLPCGPKAFTWKNCSNISGITNGYQLIGSGTSGYDSSVGTYVVPQDQTGSCADWTCPGLAAQGLGTNGLQFEYILHMVGRTAPNSALIYDNNLLYSTPQASTPGTEQVFNFIRKVAPIVGVPAEALDLGVAVLGMTGIGFNNAIARQGA